MAIHSVNAQTHGLTAESPRVRQRAFRIAVPQVFAHAVLVAVAVAVLVPFVWMVLGSFKTYPDLLSRPNDLPSPWTLANYVEIFSIARLDIAFVNSVIVSVVRTVATCLTSLVLGYVFAKYRFPGKGLLFGLILSTMMIPFPSIMVALYLKLSDFDLLDTLSGLMLVGLFSTFGILLMRQWIISVPNDFIEAARIDGASEVRIIFGIMAPLSAPPLAALAVFTFLGSWDDFLFPSIVLTNPDVKTLPLVLAGLNSLFWERYEIFCAGAMVTVVPVMVLFTAMRKQFMDGFKLVGGIKG